MSYEYARLLKRAYEGKSDLDTPRKQEIYTNLLEELAMYNVDKTRTHSELFNEEYTIHRQDGQILAIQFDNGQTYSKEELVLSKGIHEDTKKRIHKMKKIFSGWLS